MILIVDGMNYIKDFRYQLYCKAREVGVRVATVYVLATPDQCRKWNDEPGDGKEYKPQTALIHGPLGRSTLYHPLG
ncbi:chromatin associated protein KTI12-domain-containing protein [Suillus plorans]|uniref:Chromatin associated protein KTI12-domain-containing protein n=1 Tax=Suillus plorans TaxID=116603 RepID=A0A9P7AQY9_9AGAM|nr:chromatin associated protein KTI12-domain-containing protein [Suillus plorans]KAG1794586.1 chromatin associated protein KTI12-domain-containing protein [Suillus plorans]